MNERYLFKAKRIDNGEWVQGALLDGENHCLIGREIRFSPYTEHECKIVGYAVDRDTICRCTGLKDKNDNLIWENDVVRVYGDTDDFGNDLYYFYKVVWNKDLCCWWLSDIYTQEDEYLYIYLKEIEVIGNVFDNPELLEGGQIR